MRGKSGRRFVAAAKATAGQLAYEPVRRRTRPTRSPSRSTMHDGRPARALDPADPDRRSGAGGDGGRRADGAGEQAVEDVEAREQLERPLLEPRLHVAGGAAQRGRLEALVGEPWARRAHVLGDAGRAGGDADDAELSHGRGVDDRRCRASGP